MKDDRRRDARGGSTLVSHWRWRTIMDGRVRVAPNQHVEKFEPREDDQTRAQEG